MFIKEAYQRRIQQEINNHSPTYLKIKSKSPAIGSFKAGRVNFDTKETFFSDNDIPLKSKTLKIQTKQFKDPDILQLKKKNWNISVQSPRGFENFKDSHEQRLYKIKHGFYDHTNPIKQRPKRIYEGVDTRNHFQGWNVSTQVVKNQKSQNFHNITINSLDNSISFNQSKLKSYFKPTQRYEQQRSLEKQRSLNQSDLISTFREQFQKFNPKSSPQKVNATVFKLLEETRRQKLKESMFVSQDQLQMAKRFKANLSDSQKINISYKYIHNGCWSKVPWPEQGYAWSCCMNQQQKGKGCIKKVIDANKSNYSSYNNA